MKMITDFNINIMKTTFSELLYLDSDFNNISSLYFIIYSKTSSNLFL